MATTIGKLNFIVGADSAGVASGLRAGESAIGSFSSTVGGFAGKLAALFGGVSIAGMAGWGVKLAAEAETAQIGFAGLLGSGEKATAMLAKLREMGKLTPFEFGELRGSAQTLLAFGESADSIFPTLRMLGDISAGSGKDIQELTLIFGQAAAAGRLMTQDMNQLSTAGIPILGALSKHFGVTKTEVRKMVEQGKVDFETFSAVLKKMTEQGGLYFGQMDEKSQSLAGRWSTLKDTASELALAFGEKLMPALKSLTEVGINVLDWTKNLSSGTVKATFKIGAMVGAFGLAVKVIPQLVAAGKSVIQMIQGITKAGAIAQAMSGPKGWLTLLGGFAAAGAAAYGVDALFDGITAGAEKAEKQIKKTAKSTGEMAKADTGMDGLVSQLKSVGDEIKTVEDRYKNMRSAIEAGRGVFTSAAERFTTGGVESVARAAQENLIQRELVKLKDAMVSEMRHLQAREKETKEAIERKKPVQVREVNI